MDIDDQESWDAAEQMLERFRRYAPDKIIDIAPEYQHLSRPVPEPWPPVFIRDWLWDAGMESWTRSYSRAYPSKYKWRCMLRRQNERHGRQWQVDGARQEAPKEEIRDDSGWGVSEALVQTYSDR